jgi:hypothetical protein
MQDARYRMQARRARFRYQGSVLGIRPSAMEG